MPVASGTTDAEGRVEHLIPPGSPPPAGTYRLDFATDAYFQDLGDTSFYPFVSIVFELQDPTQHYHVPLLISPFGYSTYRGS